MKLIPIATGLMAITLLTACGGEMAKKGSAETMAESSAMNNNDLYEVHHEGRIYIFDDRDVYEDFLTVGETSFRKVRIGAGPKGETLVFGLTNEDKKKMSGIASVDMYDGSLEASEDFYGEMRAEGRIYVFGSLEEMNTARVVGEVPLRYTEIGAGPKGETVVYALNSSNKKVRPDAMIAKFHKMNDMK
ncbi:hypothetical protein [Marinomonas aquiplantarum]|uniref:Lipoprotein n=1 Tax=Marinomonas aquiplantarum TaxID=491951 RepID=A0A366D1H3_9GAMM|nr:hypothetical protein [Marinomonas aquiplantarum]RBO83349.1 hypothetical protein DFP76_104164 [Marinomonas aquiplantarum]